MRRTRMMAAAFSVPCLASVSSLAEAGSMDPALERLVHDAAGSTAPCGAGGRVVAGAQPCAFDNVSFKRLINQYGFALAPLAMYPARTTGFGGFQIALQGSFTSIDSSADYWKDGTRGPQDPNSGRYSLKNDNPDSWLQVYNFNLRKGLPFGIEIGVDIGYMAHTSIVSGGADLRWSLLEGFRSGLLGVLPDLSLGGAVRTITGTQQFLLTVASAEGVLSKPIPVANASVFTPYVGYQYLRIFADSGLIDGTPNTDALDDCNYQGQKVPFGVAGDDGTNGPYTGQPVCGNASSPGGSPEDLNNAGVFGKARITRHRIVFGLSYRYELLILGAQFVTDLIEPKSANGDAEAEALSGVPRQSTIALQVGAAF